MSQRIGVHWQQRSMRDALRPDLQRRWEVQRAAVEAFHVRHGRWPSVGDETENDLRLARWLERQRGVGRRNELIPERAVALEEMSQRVGEDWPT